MSTNTVHVPILKEAIVSALIEPFQKHTSPAWVLDCTLGGGGHTEALLRALPEAHGVIGVDQDAEALKRVRTRLANDFEAGRLKLLHGRFGSLDPKTLAPYLEGRPVLGILADLGFSSDQLEDPSRGISFLRDGPLDMRLDTSSGERAYDFLRSATESKIADIIYQFGEERHSRRIARSIVRARAEGHLPETTSQLARLVEQAVPGSERGGRIHPATRTFQALRIYINQELQELDHLLETVILNLAETGRMAVISFHSLEDRKVKQKFRSDPRLEEWNRKPIEADEAELERNPRARSAKLRIATRK